VKDQHSISHSEKLSIDSAETANVEIEYDISDHAGSALEELQLLQAEALLDSLLVVAEDGRSWPAFRRVPGDGPPEWDRNPDIPPDVAQAMCGED